jgi:hypothetical protein
VEGGRINPREKGVRSFHLFLDDDENSNADVYSEEGNPQEKALF